MSQVLHYPGHQLFIVDVERAENCSVYDSAGRRFVDFESGVWCTPLGHSHPRVIAALVQQLQLVAHAGFNYSCRLVDEAAGELLSVLGMEGGKCAFLCSGSEAVELMVRVARSLVERPLFLTMADSYFGAYGAAKERLEDEWVAFDWRTCASCPEARRCDEQCETWAALPTARIGAFLFEPGSSSGQVRFPPRKLIAAMAQMVSDNGGLVLVNEVTTGMGRTGEWFGHQHYDITPDAVALGKGIGNGYPVSVTALSQRVVEKLGETPVPWAQSHQNDPLGAVVAREVVRTIRDEDLISRSRMIAARLLAGLEEIQAGSGRIRELRARGLMLAIEMEDDENTKLTIHVQRELVQRGFVVARRAGLPILRLDPALTIDAEDIEAFLEALGDVLGELSTETEERFVTHGASSMP